jgi:hypothetical protein
MADAKSLRRVRLELAREKAHPEGDPRWGYEFVAPLDGAGQIDPTAWKANRGACRVRRFHPQGEDAVGHLVHRPGGSWAFRYDVAGEAEDEAGYRFGAERFVPGEYVSVHEEDGMHTFRVVRVEQL